MAVVYVHANRLHEPRMSRFTVVLPDAMSVIAELTAQGINARFAEDGDAVDTYVSEGQTVAELVDTIKGVFARKAVAPASSAEPLNFGSLLQRYASSGDEQENA